MTPAGFRLVVRCVLILLAGLYALLAAAGPGAVYLMARDGEPAGVVAFVALSALSGLVAEGALRALREER